MTRDDRFDEIIAAADALERRIDAFSEGDHPRDEDGKFKGVSVTHKKRSGETEYKKVVGSGKPNFNGSGRRTQTVTKTSGGVYSKSEHGFHQTHRSVGEAAKLFGWEEE